MQPAGPTWLAALTAWLWTATQHSQLWTSQGRLLLLLLLLLVPLGKQMHLRLLLLLLLLRGLHWPQPQQQHEPAASAAAAGEALGTSSAGMPSHQVTL